MSKWILNSLLCGLVGAMGVFFFGLILGVSSNEDGKSRATANMRIGGVGALLICCGLIVVSFIPKAGEGRPAARHLSERSRVRVLHRDRQVDFEEAETQIVAVPDARPAFRPLTERSEAPALTDDVDQDLDLDTDRAGDVEDEAFQFFTYVPLRGANCKGRLCWICGKEHGPEIVHR